MLRNIRNLFHTKNQIISKANLFTATTEKWDLFAAVCLERKPFLSKLPNALESEFQKQLTEIESERSYKSDHEIKHELDLKQEELLKKGTGDIEGALKDTAQDFADASLDELSKFKCASRTTNADKSNDLTSLNRKLDKHLVLLIDQKIGGKSFYLPPQTVREDGETLRQTADRILKDTCGPEVKAQIYSNAPSGFYKYKYPKEVQDKSKSTGAKVFIYFARHQKGQLLKKETNYKWLDRKELEQTLPEAYHKSLSQFLIDEK